MAMTNDPRGFIRVYRQLLEWEWYEDANTLKLFLHCLLKANWKEKQWQGLTIPAGSFFTSIPKLASESGLTERQVRTALLHLKSTGELTDESTGKATGESTGKATGSKIPKGRLITIKNWDSYQGSDRISDSISDRISDRTSDRISVRKTTGKRQDMRQDNDREATVTKEYKEYKELKNERSVCTHAPDLSEIETYCSENGIETDIRKFWQYNEGTGWRMDWKAALWMWVEKDKQKSREARAGSFGDFDQRSYDFDDIERQLIQGGGAS